MGRHSNGEKHSDLSHRPSVVLVPRKSSYRAAMLLCDLGETRKPGTLPLFLYRIVSRADREGRRVANGIYFYRLDTPDYRNVKKAVLMS